MYYKLIDKESVLYKKLYNLRIKELQIEEDNAERIRQRYPKWNNCFIGRKGQQNFNRVTTYSGLGFNSEQDVDLTEFKPSKDFNGIYEPNKKTKRGRECYAFFRNLDKSSYFKFIDIIAAATDNDPTYYNRFVFPYLEIGSDDNLYCYFDDKMNLPKEFIEITSIEFDKALNICS